MERYINKDNVSDITYPEFILQRITSGSRRDTKTFCYIRDMSELIPPSCFRKKAGGINSPKQLTFTSFRKLWAH